MLIADATLLDGGRADVRIADDGIVAIGQIVPQPGEARIDAGGGLLLPGLHDHHIHVAALAAARASVQCGPPEVADADQLAAALARPGEGWLRGIGYHESVAGLLDVRQLDRLVPDRPIRIQHRSGRMWFLNSRALDLLPREAPPGLDRATGRLFDADGWLKQSLAGRPPSFDAVGRLLAQRGVTGITEISPGNDAIMARHFAEEHRAGRLPQHVLLAGRLDLNARDLAPAHRLGPAKLHLHEADLPAYDDALAFVRTAHAEARPVAVHCATEVELVFTLAAFAEAGTAPGDRIEHASIAPDSAVAEIARLGLAVVSQPHFIAERGDAYAAEVDPSDRDLLYRLAAFTRSGVTLAAGSDAPFGGPDPWAAMAAAVSRQTRGGQILGPREALTPEQALALYLADPETLAVQRTLGVGMRADLCLIDRPWSAARADLTAVQVRGTWIDGRQVFDGIDQPPVERGARTDPPA